MATGGLGAVFLTNRLHFDIYRSVNNQYYFVVFAGNGERLATSETYVQKASARHAIDLIGAGAGGAPVNDYAT